ncbi:type I phosphomannose isomerase catalytic subunit [Jeotgalibacillus campisalis]|uniref:Mannose-6-phosphate isomerase n=1 Tax=Jeotgalibacillus campisalis TaxID=220754 RepID=A0A0C2RMR5_9BACL|nr:type I phosphomannose isomerase catalytic subunit [Jeotgalibacillus campisalis]KIL43044.1 mannose-6-phosphate isomerase [Jeotgalibacillus campisalis]
MSLYKLAPVFKERIWGGRKLESAFGYKIPEGPIGECWGISAHAHGESVLETGPYKGMRLSQVWEQHKEDVFGEYELNEFPLLVKVLDAAADLSVQVHPNDEQAMKLEGEPYGKTECWYVLHAEPGAELIIGHTAQTKEEFVGRVEAGEWSSLLQKKPVQKGDFLFVESGTIHAIGAGIMILEIQQSSDTTYRVYDFDRTDVEGNKRELHIEKAIEVSKIPHDNPTPEPEIKTLEKGILTKLVSTNEFTVWHHDVTSGYELTNADRFQLLSVIEGEGMVHVEKTGETIAVAKGDHFLVPKESGRIIAEGSMEWVTSEA